MLLCEDSQHEAFVRRFLQKRGWSARQIRVEKAPAGRGSGEQFVRAAFPKELRALRSGHVNRALIVVIDGDGSSVAGRLVDLEEACAAAGVPPRSTADQVVVLAPCRRIETWFAYLDGATVDESSGEYPRLARPRECARHVEALLEMCDAGSLRQPAPHSLQLACDEFNRWQRE